jgi:cytochrome c oxidase subunit 2
MVKRLALIAVGLVALVGPIRILAQDRSNPVESPIQVTARKYRFEPSTITVHKGTRVRLEVTAIDTTHGIEIKEFGVKRELKKGRGEVVEFVADKAGRFEIKCSKFCGLGHGRMKGMLIVTE